jgi:hypothetical protein
VNAFSKRTNLQGIHEEYRQEFGEFLLTEPIPYIQSLKKLTSDINYPIQAATKNRLEKIIDAVIKEGQDA